MIKAILFDMDGVLIDARDWHFVALNQALNHFGEEISVNEHKAVFDGLPTKKKLEILSKTTSIPLKLHRVINDLKQNYTMQIAAQKCKPMFNHQQALLKLKNSGFKLFVCSNSINKTVKTLMELSHLGQYLDGYLSAEEVKFPKPNPEIYLRAMSLLDVKADECLILEDNQNGIKAARESGGHLMTVPDPSYVTHEKILSFIDKVNTPGEA